MDCLIFSSTDEHFSVRGGGPLQEVLSWGSRNNWMPNNVPGMLFRRPGKKPRPLYTGSLARGNVNLRRNSQQELLCKSVMLDLPCLCLRPPIDSARYQTHASTCAVFGLSRWPCAAVLPCCRLSKAGRATLKWQHLSMTSCKILECQREQSYILWAGLTQRTSASTSGRSQRRGTAEGGGGWAGDQILGKILDQTPPRQTF